MTILRRNRNRARALALMGLILWLPAPRHAHAADGDSTGSATPAPTAPRARQSWTADRMPLRTGDLVTVVVDEQAAATEHVSRVSGADRGQQATLRANIDTGSSPTGYDVGINTGLKQGSRDVGDAQRKGGLTAVLTVKVIGFESERVARIEGHKQVTVDGRTQDVMLRGLIRTQDVGSGNTVRSSRIADAEITYKGKKLAPNSSFVGKLLGMVWP